MRSTYDYYDSPIDLLIIEIENDQLIRIQLAKSNLCTVDIEQTSMSMRIKMWLDQYFQGIDAPSQDIPVMPSGTPFQKYVWSVLQTIPYGQTLTYGQVAKMAAKYFGKEKMSSQAIGQAVSKNPILILIPCHRVIGTKQKITGFAHGIEVKKWLLEHEKIPYTE